MCVLFVCIDFNAVNTCARVMWMGNISQHTISSSDKSPVGGCVCAAGAMPQMLPDGFTSRSHGRHAVAATGSAATVKSPLAHSPPPTPT